MLIYVGGSMANRANIARVVRALEAVGHEVFCDWVMPGEETDTKWREFEKARGHTYLQALQGPHARDVFNFDKHWLDKAEVFVLVYPAGKSAHTELGYMIGRGKPSYVLMEEEPERWDVMMQFATAVCSSLSDLVERVDG